MFNIDINDSRNVYINHSCTIILNSNDINIKYDFKDGEYNVLIFNDYDGDIILNDNGTVNNSKVKINYLQLESHNLKQNTNINVNSDSSLLINTTYLGVNNKDIIFNLKNTMPKSSIDINNNVVCLKNSYFSMDCIGTILKGAKLSKCHQNNHCLTIDSLNKARILPILNIDENDVEASHSLSCGTIDIDTMFYINSRGLNNKEALNLILKSYLMPNNDYYLDFDNGNLIQEKAKKKVSDICLM